ncbi:Retrovirus-related Pol polyprotein from transposon gypsy [Nosema granulosis]|uniref:Retrovirus-related Pol polyprotein from transposon gypsy n=1 Tax=Nosema granulosis TaxID=83296 RepID=A0A9P6KXS7_9MICR|nr:Retrovirus-related Pol polyprotein from transposon gypsy [Nosema granulosis]
MRQNTKKHLSIVMNKIRAVGLSLNHKKCRFFKKEVKVLGNIIAEGNIKADPKKIATIQQYPQPQTIKELRSFLGSVNHCREFVPKMAFVTAPLYNILKGGKKDSNKKINMDNTQRIAFAETKRLLVPTQKERNQT